MNHLPNPYDEKLTVSQLLCERFWTVLLIAIFFGPLVFLYIYLKIR